MYYGVVLVAYNLLGDNFSNWGELEAHDFYPIRHFGHSSMRLKFELHTLVSIYSENSDFQTSIFDLKTAEFFVWTRYRTTGKLF